MRPLLLAALLPLGGGAWAAPAKPAGLTGAAVELRTKDGWALKARHEPAKEDRKTFILLHGRGQRKEFWQRLTRRLSKEGYGWLAVDLRGHGESQVDPEGQPLAWRKFKVGRGQDNDYLRMSLDVQAAVSFLLNQEVPEESIGLIGSDVGASIALRYAAVQTKVPMLVMLSPMVSYLEVDAVNAMRRYRDRPVLMIYGQLDKGSSKEAPILYGFAKLSVGEDRATLVSVPYRHGYQLMTPSVSRLIIDWIANPVKPRTVQPSTGAINIEGISSDSPPDGEDAELLQ